MKPAVLRSAELSIGLLGPLLVTHGGQPVTISGARRRDVLIRLVLNAGRPLEASALVESVWEGAAPAGATNSLQAHISYLRRQLGGGRLLTEGRAYRLDLDGVTVDAYAFEGELAAARAAVEQLRPVDAVGLLGRALERWRGPALIDVVDHSWGQAEIARLTELNGAAHETLLQAMLAAGLHSEAVVRARRSSRPTYRSTRLARRRLHRRPTPSPLART